MYNTKPKQRARYGGEENKVPEDHVTSIHDSDICHSVIFFLLTAFCRDLFQHWYDK